MTRFTDRYALDLDRQDRWDQAFDLAVAVLKLHGNLAVDLEGVPVPTSLRSALAGQRRIVQVGLLFMLVAVVVGTGVHHALIGVFAAVGVAMSVINALATEMGLARMVASGDELSRKQFAVSSLMRLAAIALVAFGITLVFWRFGGLAVLFGLAAFQVVSLVLNGIPLLKEMYKA